MLGVMNDSTEQSPDRPPVGTLVDFVEGVDKDNPLDIEVAVNDKGKVVVFHNRAFKKEISWLGWKYC